jgi:phenylacetate-CoA ligase
MVERSPYWNPEIETMPRKDLEKLKWERLQRQLRYNYTCSPLFRKLWDEAGIKPDGIKNMDDFQKKVPTIEKEDLRKYRRDTGDPWSGMLAAPLERVRFVGTTTGTTGEHVMHPWTTFDGETRFEAIARSIWGVGGRPGMRVWAWFPVGHTIAIAAGIYDDLELFSERLGMPRIEFGYNTMMNWSGEMWFPEILLPIFRYCKPNIIVALVELLVPSLEYITAKGLDGHEIFRSVKALACSAGLMTEGLRKTIQEITGTKVYDLYSHGDLAAGPCECAEAHHIHIAEDIMMLEILDPFTKEPVAPGERGELTWTDLVREGYPLCRWMSEDIGFLDTEPCPCGRTHYRFKCIGRRGWLFKLKGKTWTPFDVEEDVLRKVPATVASEYYMERYAPDMDELILNTTYDHTVEPDEEKLREQIGTKIREVLGVNSEIRFAKPEELPRAAHKVIHVVDKPRAA